MGIQFSINDFKLQNIINSTKFENLKINEQKKGFPVGITKNFFREGRYNKGNDLNKNDYNKILEDDTINVLGLESFNTNDNLKLELLHKDGSTDIFEVCHYYNNNQIEWFKAGSALNLIASGLVGS